MNEILSIRHLQKSFQERKAVDYHLMYKEEKSFACWVQTVLVRVRRFV